MFSIVHSAALTGISCRIIQVQTDVSDGLPGFFMVGDLASEVRESQGRVKTALRNSGFAMTAKRIVINLAPADLRKTGTAYDLAIAVALLTSYRYLDQSAVEKFFFAGELGLDGSICRVPGILGMVQEAKRAGFTDCIVPAENAEEGGVIKGIHVFGAGTLREAASHLGGAGSLRPVSINIEDKILKASSESEEDFSDVHGQSMAKRAAEIAAAGMHHLLLSGPPGSGKSMIAKRIPGILPTLSVEEALEVSQIHSVAGTLPTDGIISKRPFRMPHQSVSASAFVGGGMIPHPGEISLAHRGVLYLDEMPEFSRDVLESLRQPMEEGKILISRANAKYEFPAKFMLVGSRNPCRCGYYLYDRSRCSCTESEVRAYQSRISRPLLDRFDLHVEVRPVAYQDLWSTEREESSAEIRARVEKAQQIQNERYRGSPFHFNAELTAAALEQYCILGEKEQAFAKNVFETKQLTARACHRMIRVARTIADLEGSQKIQISHLCEAVRYRSYA